MAVNAAGNYTKPKMRKRLFNEINAVFGKRFESRLGSAALNILIAPHSFQCLQNLAPIEFELPEKLTCFAA